ncbi:hypothetical protein [Marivivens sp. JLT3646]|jgi:hypothetical protein|uniref:hypothetical protein n=1 Tax=Marivivens sp. JLT3646 TaxID=1920883 RepID=UPI0007FBB65B|nr:hypothetical protein [Marivivens sp. JLT3646]APO86010.1 hypothetical protein BSK21_02515 [Marivivens sp. JLT3646]OBR36902.1 hypothetical protein A9199_06030 [Donghicola sp. JL3646]
MAFRMNEQVEVGRDRAKRYLIPREFTKEQREAAAAEIHRIERELGPVVSEYPSWHPLVRNHSPRLPETFPNRRCGYEGLDHTVWFVNGFITCPYTGSGNVQKIIDSVEKLPSHPKFTITIRELETRMYFEGTTTLLVKCEWSGTLPAHQQIPKSLAIPLMLQQEIPAWEWAVRSESWTTMQRYILGEPCGNRSSLFVDQETGLALKKAYQMLVDSGMYGLQN